MAEISFLQFRRDVMRYFRAHGRDVPWRNTHDPYRILVSEVMLQQTQVPRVIPKYLSFLKRFPDVRMLARAPVSSVLRQWQGLGYNRRALMLRRCAQRIAGDWGCAIPDKPEILETLPGIGPYTARAIAVFAFNRPEVFIETNIRRAYLRHFFVRRRHVHDREILKLLTFHLKLLACTPREWYSALMDYGSMLGGILPGKKNPNRKSRRYVRQSRFQGSRRQLRGKIVRMLIAGDSFTLSALAQKIGVPAENITPVAGELAREGFLVISRGKIRVSRG